MVKIITDTTACLPTSVQIEYDIPVIPQMIHFGEYSYTEGLDIDAILLWKNYACLKNCQNLCPTARNVLYNLCFSSR